MRKLIIIVILIALISACKNKPGEKETNFLTPRPDIKAVLDSFVKVNGANNPEYNLYINKQSPHEYDLIIYTGSNSPTAEEDLYDNQYPVNKVRTSGVEFKIYSGIEHYFHTEHNENRRDTSANDSISDIGDVFWIVKDSFGVLNTYEIEFAYPFMRIPENRPAIEFTMPVIED